MKKFLCKFIILMCIVATFCMGINEWYKKKLFSPEDVPSQLQVVNVGSSHAFYGLYYEELELEGVAGFNLALSGQVPSYDLGVLKEFQDNLEKGGICLIPISWFSFVWDEEAADGFELKNNRYYALVDRKYIKQYSLEKDIRLHWGPALYAGRNIFDETEQYGLALAKREERWYTPVQNLDFSEHAERSYQGQVLDWNNVILQEEITAVYEMVEACRENNVTPVFITFPFTKEFNDCADENLDITFYDVMEKIVGTTNVQWYDYSADDRFVENKELFMDSNHLNYEGAKLFTNIVGEEIIKPILEND